MDYTHVDDDFRRSIADNNLQAAEREHASTALAHEAAVALARQSEDDSAKTQYNQQATELSKRLVNLEAQCKVWKTILKSIPSMTETELAKAKDNK